MALTSNVANKNRSTDVILRLRPKDGKAKSAIGVTDNRLFTGGNNLHVKMDPQTCLWRLEYEHGQLPLIFKQQFTGLQRAITKARDYFEVRGVEIYEIVD